MRAWLVLLLLVPLAAGQGHEHAMGSGFAVVTDLGPDGFAYAGIPVHFEIIVFGEDDVPDFHQDIPVRVLLDNKTLYETTTVSGHDYDGVHGFDIVFPRPGPWRFEALLDGDPVAYLEGIAHPLPAAVFIGGAEASGIAIGPGPADFTFTTQVDGSSADHSDLLVEAVSDGRIVFRTHLHLHDGEASFQYTEHSGAPTTLMVTRYTAFPTEDATPIAPFTSLVSVPGRHVPVPTAPSAPSALPPKNAAERIDAGEYVLVGTYDPFTQVGPDTLQHLNVLIIDPKTGMPVPHVDFEAELRGPPGLIFSSSDLHEYDGIYSLEARQALPGQYVLDVTATRGDWSGEIQLIYYVLPPVVATLLGPQTVELDTTSFVTGRPTPFQWSITDVAGRPFAHGEIDLRIVQQGSGELFDEDLVLVRDKLHTHGDGAFPITYAFPEPGDYTLLTDPFPLDPQPAGPFTYNQMQLAAGYVVTATGDAPLAPTPAQPADAPGESAPIPLALLLLALMAATWRRKP